MCKCAVAASTVRSMLCRSKWGVHNQTSLGNMGMQGRSLTHLPATLGTNKGCCRGSGGSCRCRRGYERISGTASCGQICCVLRMLRGMDSLDG